MTFPLRTPLRRDPRAWTIEDDEIAEASLKALETLGLVFAEIALHRISRLGLGNQGDHDLDLALRAMGSVSGRVAMTRLAHLTGRDHAGRPYRSESTETEQAVGERLALILDWLLEWDHANPDAPPNLRPPSPPPPAVRVALDEIHASLLWLDRRARTRGTDGPGRARNIIRSTTRGAN